MRWGPSGKTPDPIIAAQYLDLYRQIADLQQSKRQPLTKPVHASAFCPSRLAAKVKGDGQLPGFYQV
jgi:hypothetical protein